MSFDITIIKIISTLAITVPLALNVRILRTGGITFWLFFAFLLIGFFTDLLGWYNYYINYELKLNRAGLKTVVLYTAIFYSVAEAVFFAWLVTEYLAFKKIRLLRAGVFVVITIWIVYILYRDLSAVGDVSFSAFFDAFYQIVVSFIAGFLLLDIAEKESDMIRLPLFWILTGVFFYCFSTFFIFVIKLIVTQRIADQLWLVHDMANIFTYIFYSIGICRYRTGHAVSPI